LLRRSQLFVPGNDERKIRKSTSIDADSIIFDLEDAVPEDFKAKARDSLRTLIGELEWDSRRELCVRVNKAADGKYSPEDLDAAKSIDKISSLVLPKIEARADQIHESTGKNVIGLVETARGLVNIRDIAESKGAVALCFGPQDYANSVRGDVSAYVSNPGVITSLVAAARAFDLDPIDGVYFELANLEGFRRAAQVARDLGCSGKQVVHPSQVTIANEVFTPSEQEISEAQKIVELYENAQKQNTGAIRVDDMLIDAVHYRRAKDLLDRVP
jgi:citrate lyase subunit beta / citryl-CoA lyase